MSISITGSQETRLQPRVTCPHCWNAFAPEQGLWIAQHPDLLGDARLGRDQPQRFLPTRFTVEGAAIDARGFPCHDLACPKCHLPVPRPLFEMPPVFLSILGAPACGKSYFLASMTWQMRRVLPQHFALDWGDADPVSNLRLQEYIERQFLNPEQDALVAIDPTQTQGDLYDTAMFGTQPVTYPRPFLFRVSPLATHPRASGRGSVSRVLCLYDNAGESFLPGQDTATSPVTRHMALSHALLFLFDPTQDVSFRSACRGKTHDPQMEERSQHLERERAIRQETVLAEAAQRIRKYGGLGQDAKHNRPLIVVITKFDSWAFLMKPSSLPCAWVENAYGGIAALDLDLVATISRSARDLLWRLTPELVSAAESFAHEVLYVPLSATGRSPESDARIGLGFRPRDIHPIWVGTPLLYIMARWMSGLVPYQKANPLSNGRQP